MVCKKKLNILNARTTFHSECTVFTAKNDTISLLKHNTSTTHNHNEVRNATTTLHVPMYDQTKI